jgi:hypothetical protein
LWLNKDLNCLVAGKKEFFYHDTKNEPNKTVILIYGDVLPGFNPLQAGC